MAADVDECPRCGQPQPSIYYGPCAACRAALRLRAAQQVGFRRFVFWLTTLVSKGGSNAVG